MPIKGHFLEIIFYVNSGQCPESLCVDLWDEALWPFKVWNSSFCRSQSYLKMYFRSLKAWKNEHNMKSCHEMKNRWLFLLVYQFLCCLWINGLHTNLGPFHISVHLCLMILSTGIPVKTEWICCVVCQEEIFFSPFLHLFSCSTLWSTLLWAAPYKPMFGLLLTSPPGDPCKSKCWARLTFESQKNLQIEWSTDLNRGYSKSRLLVRKSV